MRKSSKQEENPIKTYRIRAILNDGSISDYRDVNASSIKEALEKAMDLFFNCEKPVDVYVTAVF